MNPIVFMLPGPYCEGCTYADFYIDRVVAYGNGNTEVPYSVSYQLHCKFENHCAHLNRMMIEKENKK